MLERLKQLKQQIKQTQETIIKLKTQMQEEKKNYNNILQEITELGVNPSEIKNKVALLKSDIEKNEIQFKSIYTKIEESLNDFRDIAN